MPAIIDKLCYEKSLRNHFEEQFVKGFLYGYSPYTKSVPQYLRNKLFETRKDHQLL